MWTWEQELKAGLMKEWAKLWELDYEIPNLLPSRSLAARRRRMEAALKEKYTHEIYGISFIVTDDSDGTDKPGVENG